MQQIKTGRFDKWYIFYGEEHQVMKMYFKKIAERGYTISYVDSIYDLVSTSRVSSLLDRHHLYIIIDDKDFLTTEKMWDKFTGLKNDLVVFYYTSSDQRLKFWKKFKDRAVEFKKLDDSILIKYIQKDIKLSEENCHKLIEICENDYGRICLEIDKIKHFDHEAVNSAFEHLLKSGVIYQPPKDAIFDFVSAFLDRQPLTAYELLEQSRAIGEPNMVLLSVMYNNVRNLLVYQSSKPGDDTGLSGWDKKNVAQYKGRYSNGELARAMRLIREAESGIKKGLIPDEYSVEYVLVNIM